MPSRLLPASLALLFLVPPAHAAGPDAKAIAAVVERARKFWNVPGVAVAVVRGDEVISLQGHGLRQAGKKDPITPDTLFPIGSCSKAFTTAALAMLVDEGKVSWDDRVRKHLPSFRLADPLANADVRLRDLMCHRTGLGGHHLLWYGAPWSPEEAVRRAGKLPLDRPFRSAFQYQSTMFTAAGLAVARVSGAPWQDVMKKRLFGPLGMKGTVCTSTEALASPDCAEPHKRNGRGEVVPMPRYVMEAPDPAGSVHSSARDLARWLSFHLAQGQVKGKRLVSAGALGETHTPQIPLILSPPDRERFPDTVQLSYGLAWVIHDHRALKLVSHGGAIDGFRVHLTLVPARKLGIALLGNLHQTEMNLALSNSLLDLLLGLPKKDWNALHAAALRKVHARAEALERARRPARRPGTKPSHGLSSYAGTYEHPAYGRVRVSLERGKLVWRWRDYSPALAHYHYDTFTLSLGDQGEAFAVFGLDEAGRVERLKVTAPLGVEFRRVVGR
jgi:CubicO group peptidase (beta-lactamase class C family)